MTYGRVNYSVLYCTVGLFLLPCPVVHGFSCLSFEVVGLAVREKMVTNADVCCVLQVSGPPTIPLLLCRERPNHNASFVWSYLRACVSTCGHDCQQLHAKYMYSCNHQSMM